MEQGEKVDTATPAPIGGEVVPEPARVDDEAAVLTEAETAVSVLMEIAKRLLGNLAQPSLEALGVRGRELRGSGLRRRLFRALGRFDDELVFRDRAGLAVIGDDFNKIPIGGVVMPSPTGQRDRPIIIFRFPLVSGDETLSIGAVRPKCHC